MPRKRSAIGVRTPAARRMAARAARGQSSRTLENPQQSLARLQSDRLRQRVERASENPQQSQARLQSDRLRHRVQRASETPQQSQTRQEADRLRYFRQRASTWADVLNAAFHYNPALNYEQFTFLQIGHMDKQWKVQGQVYHRIGSVLPPLNSDSSQLQPAFLQVFFIGDSAEVATRHRNFPITKPHIVSILQDMLHQHNPYVHLFTASIEKMPSPDYKLVIKADKAPPGHHPRTFNAPTINEVAIVVVQESCDRRDIVLSKRGSGVQRINEFHRSYDALQYPLVFWNGQDGYHFHIPQLIDGFPSAHKTVSGMDFYASLLMIRSRNPGITNWLLAFVDLTHQTLTGVMPLGDIFGKPQCWCYTIEWRKRGLPHAHILLWLKEKIRPNQIDSIICTEIPNEEASEEGGFSFVKRVRVFTIENGVQVVRMTNVTIDNRNPTSFAALRTINGVLCQTYKEACMHLGLLENDQQWHHCIQEAVLSDSPLKIRELFAIILTCCPSTNPQDIWAQFKEPMSADILNLARQQANDGLLQLTYEMSNQALILLEQKVMQMTGFHLTKFGMRSPQRNATHRTSHKLLRETSYDLSSGPSLKDAMQGLTVARTEEIVIAPVDNSCATRTFLHRLEQADKIRREILALPRLPTTTMSHGNHRKK
ncbi:hypothetical protein LAZ67_2003162 [Cordylochernes scorpioides]|uniref:Helitron helicase-like domain-containing protein n=1 Tax=Cordylochernes scorpioides TaxID=51811 RepID=A0ABY6K2S9_9ARAC|nr:hypothetical protein LAZ67_2003162 [Cordylochernes scorpioides]